MIEITNLSKSFGSNKIFENINLTVKKGELVALVGFSGCGKSTLLKIIAGLEPKDSGEVKLSSNKLGMAFQYSALFDSLNVRDNIVFPLIIGEHIKKLPSEDELNAIAAQKLALVGLTGIESQFPSELSGGMKKRISFARAIVNDPEIILYDEPTAGLDPVASTIIEDLIVKIQKETKSAGIVVTHQASTIKRAVDRVVMLYDCSIVWQGSPKELFDSANSDPYAKQFRDGTVEGPMQVKS
ncbi:MAG: ATP-binding cassette domain-containing protein [Candidatus Caenarcaniphilales bacterium]|jgi:phospholipid/cholesterol/gamma-HCH transport system ATP-binding protein|nr:ATP-binding cassette domain-containing protein [Candidatus Caenarcaniphilales bacterium]